MSNTSVSEIEDGEEAENPDKVICVAGIPAQGPWAVGKPSEQFKRFKEILEKRGIKYKDLSDPRYGHFIERVHFWYKRKLISVIHGFGTYGGWNSFQSDSGLLEVWADRSDEPVGYLTAKGAELLIFGGNVK